MIKPGNTSGKALFIMFLDVITKRGYESISFVGMAKNAGKTTAFNFLLKECFQNQYPIGIASLGRDGEKRDVIFNFEKPSIWIEAGTMAAVAMETITENSIPLEILEDTGYSSPLGQIYITRAKKSGYLEIATTPSAQRMKNIVKLMKSLGARLVVVDGAIDRVSLAAPEITDCTILATGAALHTNMETVVRKTAARVQQLTLPMLKDSDGLLAIEKKSSSGQWPLIMGDNGTHAIMHKNFLVYERQLLSFLNNHELKYVYINGAVLEGLLNFFINNRKLLQNTTLVINNGAKVLVDYVIWERYMKYHGSISVIKPINLMTITCNPTSHKGYAFSPEEFAGCLADRIGTIRVIDVVAGICI
ncbi:MAG: hypothetical protein KGZ94_12240 [Clostridia bacterium]|jgi:hypothetical protein|nr:hypothetical protein [Clostridia bacterium]